MARYHYYISFDSGSNYSEIYLSNWPKFTTIRENTNADYRYCYRTNYADDMKISQRLNSTVYATLLAWFIDNTKWANKILVKCYRGTSGTGTLKHSGFFSVTDGKIQKEVGMFTVRPFTDDVYQDFDNIKDTQYNAYPGGCNIYNQVASPSINWANDPVNGFNAGTWNAVANVIYNGTAILGAFSAAEAPLNILNGVPVTVVITGQTGTAPYMRLVDASYSSISNYVTASNGTYVLTPTADATGYLQVYYNGGGSTPSFGLTAAITSPGYTSRITGSTEPLRTFLERLLSGLLLMNLPYGTGKVKSTYLWNDALPTTSQPPTIAAIIAAHPTYNYVTGAANLLNYLVLSCRFKWVTSGSQSLDMFYFRDLMSSIHSFLPVYWYIDDDGNFRIEHETWFRDLRSNGTDITGSTFTKYKPEVDAKEISVAKELVYYREHWVNQYQYNTDFLGQDIVYDIYSTNKSSKEYRNSLVSTDLPYLLTLSGQIGGFLLTNCDCINPTLLTKFITKSETGVLSGTSQDNGHMSMANLHDKYWKDERLVKVGTMNGSVTTFNTVAPNNRQNVKFPLTTDLDYFKNIITSQGNGLINTLTRDTDSDFLQVELLYEV